MEIPHIWGPNNEWPMVSLSIHFSTFQEGDTTNSHLYLDKRWGICVTGERCVIVFNS